MAPLRVAAFGLLLSAMDAFNRACDTGASQAQIAIEMRRIDAAVLEMADQIRAEKGAR